MPQLKETSAVCLKPQIIRFSFGMEEANSYAVIKGNHAVIIDACAESLSYELKSRKITADYLLLTHEHCDHLWGVNKLREDFPSMKTIAQVKCSEALPDSRLNKAWQYRIYASFRYGEEYNNKEALNKKFRCDPAEICFKKSYEFSWEGLDFKLISTPGHSPGSSMIFLEGAGIFSGDVMIKGEKTFLEFEGGNKKDYEDETVPVIDAIGAETLIFPGHGTSFRKKDWR